MTFDQTPFRTAIILKKKTYIGQNVSKRKITGSAGWNVIADSHYVELYGSSSITELALPYCPVILLLGIHSQKMIPA